MRQRLRLLLYYTIFWISFQVLIRAVFLFYNHDFTEQLTSVEILKVFLNGLKMDISLSGYFLMLTGLILTVSIFNQSKWLYFALNLVSVSLLLFSCIVVMIDLELYRHWGFRLDRTPLFYLAGTESEALGSVEVSVVIKLFLILVALFTISLFVYSLWLVPKLPALNPATKKKSAIILLLVTALMFIPIRGSFSVAPMNIGFVYFHSTKPFANHAAINVVWNFLYSLQKKDIVKYPENFFDKNSAEKYFKTLYPKDDSTFHLFSEKKPNIIIFMLESFTADIIEPLGGVKGITPNFKQLCSEGILFDNFYASGDRTDKGILSVLSGYPAQPQTSIVKYHSKSQRLPYLNHFIRDLGYRTSFIYGGDIDFASLRSYLTNSRFDHITADEDFPDEDESKWGVHDHIVFEKAFQECDTTKDPFFKVILSLSSHEPFDVPGTRMIEGQDEASLFLNACHYTDKSLGDFINNAKKTDWWQNTVVLILADHGHRLPNNKELIDERRFHIPLLMVGGAIKRDSVIHTYSSQTDIANTLLGQLSKPDSTFKFSKNILSPKAKSFAVYFFNNGYGYVKPDAYIVYDNTGKQFLKTEGATKEDLEISKAYQQILFLDFNSK